MRPVQREDFYRLGMRWIGPLSRANVWRNSPFLRIALAGGIAIAGVGLSVTQNAWLVSFTVVLILLEALQSYLSGAEVEAAAISEREAREEVWDAVRRLQTDVTGHLAAIVTLIVQYKMNTAVGLPRVSAEEFRLLLRNHQQHLLAHAVNVVADHLNLGENRRVLSANWCVREPDDLGFFRVQTYDRSMHDRLPDSERKHVIAPEMPGASQSFLTHESAFVADTRDESVAKHFPAQRPYRSILSIPAVLGDSWMIGVMNIDAKEPGVLAGEHEVLVQDTAYLLALCEVLSRLV
jgi:hypothetical protein